MFQLRKLSVGPKLHLQFSIPAVPSALVEYSGHASHLICCRPSKLRASSVDQNPTILAHAGINTDTFNDALYTVLWTSSASRRTDYVFVCVIWTHRACFGAWGYVYNWICTAFGVVVHCCCCLRDSHRTCHLAPCF